MDTFSSLTTFVLGLQILEQQKKEKPGSMGEDEEGAAANEDVEEQGVEMGPTTRRRGVKTETAD